MKMNSKNLDELINRYFDAETTLEEERELQRLITGPYASDARYDEVRAVMGFTAVGRKLRRKSHRAIRWWQAAAAAVVVLMLGGVYTIQQAHPDDVCIGYVFGRNVTNPEVLFNIIE